jgi:predicted nucleic acid-binding protein
VTSILLDTGVLLRLADPGAPEHEAVRAGIARAMSEELRLYVTAQVLIEFWVVATRPRDVNGFEWEPARVAKAIDGLLKEFDLLPDCPDVLDRWLALVSAGIRGKRAHDARLAAVMLVYGVEEVLTLNPHDFEGIPGIRVRLVAGL